MTRRIDAIIKLTVSVLAMAVLLSGGGKAEAKDSCLAPDNTERDVVISTPCDVPGGANLIYRYVNIVAGGTLNFLDGGDTHFWASAILVEKDGALTAGTPSNPIGTTGNGRVTIHLWGAPQPGVRPGAAESSGGSGVPCTSPKFTANCGAPDNIWTSNVNGHEMKPPDQARKVKDLGLSAKDLADFPGVADDYFYAYHPLFHDGKNEHAYFGYKVLGVGYGGTLQLFGAKGAIYAKDAACKPTVASSTGRSWVRLANKKTANAGDPTITVETPACGLGWADGDDIVITTTDYLPGHSEQRKISGKPVDNNNGTTTITLDKALEWTHHGERFPLDAATHKGIDRVGLSADLTANGAETRAAVGLLSRSIRIVSAGAAMPDPKKPETLKLPDETSAECTSGADPSTNTCYFGGHTVFRQGYRTVQIQGVEFYQLGQGGRLGHYPVHFHHARKTHNANRPDLDTFVMDSSIWDSMTRWIVLHGTQDVTLARNVGYKSIGHGFYLEDATEINNKLLANLGVYARAAVASVNAQAVTTAQPHNPRRVPGILMATNINTLPIDNVPYQSDADHPTVFWITNGWNDFQYNQAAGAGTCGACYWFLPAYNSGMSRGLRWESYASMQTGESRAGMTPLKSFIGNACISAMMSFNTVGNTTQCNGVFPVANAPYLQPIPNPLARQGFRPDLGDKSPKPDLDYFPGITGGYRQATLGDVDFAGKPLPFCGPKNETDPHKDTHDCSDSLHPQKCSDGQATACTITTLDHYTSSFNWAPTNFAALWGRNQWYLLTNSVISDIQNGGVNFVSGGGYTVSDRITGNWQLIYKNAFIGQTQPDAHTYALNGGPFSPKSKLACDQAGLNYCLSAKEGVSFQIENHAVGQRLISFYDGPTVQDSNAFLRVKTRTIDDCLPKLFPVTCPVNSDDPACTENCHFLDPEKTKKQCDKFAVGHCDPRSAWLVGATLGLPKGYKNPDKPKEEEAFCYMPNAAIAWKQPNGFYYPPAFRSRNLYFDDVDIRHFVIEPLFKEGTLNTDTAAAQKVYCEWNDALFTGFTDIDRQTVLLDEDGSLTGWTSSKVSSPPSPLDKTTTVVNLDPSLAAPVEAIECLSDRTSRTTPYEYVTSVVYPGCSEGCGADWGIDCAGPHCYGIPLYRQDALPNFDTENGTKPYVPKSIRMMGQLSPQRSSITVNHGKYYLNTAVRDTSQRSGCPGGNCATINTFRASQTYYLFTIYAKPTTKQTYQIYVGTQTGFRTQGNTLNDVDVWLTQADIRTKVPVFKPKRTLAADEATYDSASGILTVTLDHTKIAADFVTAAKDNCAPTTYCQWKDNTCVDAGGSDAICRWAVVDLDCPAGGCFGIAFRMPGTFAADDVDHRPQTPPEIATACLPDAPPWNLSLIEKSDGTCPQPGDNLKRDFCKPKASGSPIRGHRR